MYYFIGLYSDIKGHNFPKSPMDQGGISDHKLYYEMCTYVAILLLYCHLTL